jgi:para-aminobenzoate synthetase component 1
MRSVVHRGVLRAPNGAPEAPALESVGLDRPTPRPMLAVAPASMSPYAAAPRLLGPPRLVLLDSSSANSHSGRYSYLAAAPFLTIRSRGHRVELAGPAGQTVVEANPFDLLRYLVSRYSLPRQSVLLPLLGGAVDCFDYDLGRLLESLSATNPADETLPESDVSFHGWVLAADHFSGEGWLIASGLPAGTEMAVRCRLTEIGGA